MNRPWWERAVIYQIYPRSFQDSNGDGIGDLRGIAQRIDYLKHLGVDAVWLSPVFPSPMADFGYDIADYTDIDPIFGTLQEFDELIDALHARDLRLVMDFVPNHTSDRHPWFEASRHAREDSKRDWYIWRDPAPDGGPPNNWQSAAGGSAWTFDPGTGQYYYHAFLPEQPDLNWRNLEVQAAMHDVLRFWLRRGVDGFRVDVLWHLMKDPEFRDDPINPAFSEGDPPFARVIPTYSCDQTGILEVVAGLRRVITDFGERVLIGEIYLPLERLMAYYGVDLDGAHLPFNFQLIGADWEASHLLDRIARYDAAVPKGAWGNWVLGNHDKARIASRIGPAQARNAAMLLLTLRGTPTLYQGDELGMENVPIPPDRVRDPFERNMPGTGEGRDPQRTPMQWSSAPGAGFTTGEPWLPLAEDAATRNVETMSGDPGSILGLYRALLDLRRREPALTTGAFMPVGAEGDVLLYARSHEDRRFLIALNLRPHPATVALPVPGAYEVVLSTAMDRGAGQLRGEVGLRPDEGVLLLALPAP